MASVYTKNISQLKTLTRFRWLRTRNALRVAGWPLVLLATVGTAMLLVVGGWVLSPDEFGPTPSRGLIHWGGWALEASFYLSCGIAILQSFRIMEGFFRHDDARVLATLPARLPALFLFRLGAALLETAALAVGCGLFLLPVLLKGGGPYYLASLTLLGCTTLLVVAVGFAAQMGAGVANYQALPGFFAELDRRSGGPGGGSAAYLFSPAVALGISVFVVLICKMSLDEVFKATDRQGSFYLPGIARYVGGAVIVCVVGCLAWSYRLFVRHYPLLFARFFETDLHRVDVGYDYFKRDRRPPRGLEARLATRIRNLYRLQRLQLARRTPVTRLGLFIAPFAFAGVCLAYGERFAPWMVVAVILTWTLALVSPWSRLWHPDMEPGMGLVLPVSTGDWRRARQILLAREVAMIVVPLGLLATILPENGQRLAGLVAIMTAFSAIPFVDWMSSHSHRFSRLAGVIIAMVLAVLTHSALWAATIGVAVTALASFTVGWGRRRDQDVGAEHG